MTLTSKPLFERGYILLHRVEVEWLVDPSAPKDTFEMLGPTNVAFLMASHFPIGLCFLSPLLVHEFFTQCRILLVDTHENTI